MHHISWILSRRLYTCWVTYIVYVLILYRTNFLLVTYFLLVFTPIAIFNNTVLQATIIIDLFSRTTFNSSSLTCLYFMWTHIWYIPLFLVGVILLTILNTIYISRVYTLCFLGLLGLQLLLTLLEFFHLQYYTFLELHCQDQLNSLLVNSVNKIHPLLLYLACIKLVVCMYQYVGNTYTSIIAQLFPVLLKQILNTFIVAVILLLLTLLLGGWWAAQEGSWGGWWNWDASEFFGLLMFFLLLTPVHRVALTTSFIFYKSLLNSYAFVIISFFMLLQINFTDVSHNFGFHNSTFNNLLLLQLLSLILIVGYLVIIRSIYTINYKYFILPFTLLVTFFILPRVLMSFLLTLNIITVFITPLLLEFSILLTHLHVNFSVLIFTTLVIITSLLTSSPSSSVYLNTYFITSPLTLVFINTIRLTWGINNLLHTCLIISIFVHCYFVHSSIVVHELLSQPFFTNNTFNVAYLTNSLQLATVSTDESSSFGTKLLKLEYSSLKVNTIYFTDLIFQKFITTYTSFIDLSLCVLVLILYVSFILIVVTPIVL